jgi:2-methylcitrate dehydratase PrpD
MRWVLSYTAQEAGGLASWQRDTDHIEKSFDFGGMPARNGVTAALLVQAGATGVDDILAGPDNFLSAFGPKNSADLAQSTGPTRPHFTGYCEPWTVLVYSQKTIKDVLR